MAHKRLVVQKMVENHSKRLGLKFLVDKKLFRVILLLDRGTVLNPDNNGMRIYIIRSWQGVVHFKKKRNNKSYVSVISN